MQEKPQPASLEVLVKGMHCAGCASRLETVLKGTEGVESASVNFATGTASVRGDASRMTWAAVAEAVRGAGFEAALWEEGGEYESRDAELKRTRRSWIWALAGFVPLAAVSMAGHAFPSLGGEWMHFRGRWLCEAAVSGGVVLGAGRGILAAALRAVRSGRADMDFLVGAGAFLAWAGSLLALLLGWSEHGEVYFEAAAGIVTFALLGRWLEGRARSRAGAAIRALAEMQPGAARVEVGAIVREIPVAELAAGMVMRVAPGERIPADGLIVEGASAVDESWVTGESVPVLRSAGASVVGGTINGEGALRVRVSTSGKGTFLQQVIRIVREAQTSKPPIQRLADKVSGGFSAAVACISVLTAAAWGMMTRGDAAMQSAFWHGLSVLVVACPCALGLATPIAVLAGSGAGARRGILFRSGAALEKLAALKVAVFDKTGTLTQGRMEVVEWWEREDFEHGLIHWVAAVERESAHPVAAAVVRAAESLAAKSGGVKPVQFRAVKAEQGRGLRAEVEGRNLAVGGADWLAELGVVFDESTPEERESRVWIAVDGVVAGWFRVDDRLRPEAREVLETLAAWGVKPVLLTGDSAPVARRVAAELGIGTVLAGVRPSGKRDAVRELQSGGAVVAMLGDGVNDAPALAQADVGVAMGGGTAVARQTADVTLMRDDLRAFTDAVSISRRTRAVIRQNLAFAFGYNLIAIPLAAGLLESSTGWAPGPVAASAAMALSSVSVVLNALRLSGRVSTPRR